MSLKAQFRIGEMYSSGVHGLLPIDAAEAFKYVAFSPFVNVFAYANIAQHCRQSVCDSPFEIM